MKWRVFGIAIGVLLVGWLAAIIVSVSGFAIPRSVFYGIGIVGACVGFGLRWCHKRSI